MPKGGRPWEARLEDKGPKAPLRGSSTEINTSTKEFWLQEMKRCDKETQAIDHELNLFQVAAWPC